MLVVGLDMGHLTTKVVVLKDDDILASTILMAAEEGEIEAMRALELALEGTGFADSDIEYMVATGAGRKSVPFAQKQRATASCLARGINRMFPSVRTVIDVGAETSIAVRVNEKGGLDDSASNERCASGTGVFLEAMATRLLHMSLEEMAQRSLLAEGVAEVSNMCAIFAEQEVISHVHREPPTPMNDIIAGIHASMATRVGGMAKRIGVREDVAFTGGVAKNIGFVKTMKDNLGIKLIIPEEPQLVAALGAAYAAREEVTKRVKV
ncbi:MAG: 2-hydroxyglutaryl-CoA dehydratase [Chloroflexi bacterium]|nr:2-hydroxyglutaryl-CoA dehydratase [Chloroflexota bacterium]